VTAVLPDPTIRALAEELATLKLRLDDLENGARTDQLGFSSIENGSLSIYDTAGLLRSRLGRQDDGTFVGGVSSNNPSPPPSPSPPTVTGTLAGLRITGNGPGSGDWPADFDHYNVYTQVADGPAALVGTLVSDDDVFVTPVAAGTTVTVWLTSVNLSGTESPPSLSVDGTANQVVGDDILHGAVDELALADAAVSAAKLAAAAVTETKVAPGSINTPHFVAGAVNTAALAAGSVAAGKVAANTITAREVLAASLTGNEIAGNTVTATNLRAGAVDASVLAADLVLASRVIVGAANGDRLELHPTAGLQGFKDGARTLSFDVATGNLLATGRWSTAAGGERLVVDTDGTMRFYDVNNTIVGMISNGAGAGVTVTAGAVGSRGALAVSTGAAHVFWGNPGAPAVNSDIAASQDVVVIRSPVITLETDRRFGPTLSGVTPQFIFRQRDTSGNAYPSEIAIYQCGVTGGAGGPTQEQMISWTSRDIGLSATNDIGGGVKAVYVRDFNNNPQPIAASTWITWSSRERKTAIRAFAPEDLFAAFEQAPAYQWRYRHGDDAGPVEHLSPMAEDLVAVAPELVWGTEGPDMALDQAAMSGWLWAAVGRLHARVRELETGLGVA
jgi:hypothetical protein